MWWFVGLLIGVGLVSLVVWVLNRKIVVRWYEWLIGALGLGLLLFMLQNVIASIAEMETTAAWQFLWIIGLPAIILLALAWWLPWRRHHKAGS